MRHHPAHCLLAFLLYFVQLGVAPAQGQGRNGSSPHVPEARRGSPSDGASDPDADLSTPGTPLPPGSTLLLLPGGDLEDALGNASAETFGFEMQVRASIIATLSRIGYNNVAPNELRRRLKAKGKSDLCSRVLSCDRKALLRTLGADGLVVYALWMKSGRPAQLTVSVTRRDFEGQASREVTPKSVVQQTKGLLATALGRAERPTRVAVHIDAHPKGAKVGVDKLKKRRAPATFSLAPGAHRLVVEKRGYVTVLDQFTLGPDQAAFHRTVRLDPVARKPGMVAQTAAQQRLHRNQKNGSDAVAKSSSPKAGREEMAGHTGQINSARQAQSTAGGLDAMPAHAQTPSHTADYLLGAALATAAASLLSVGIVTLVRDGDCRRRSEYVDECVERQQGQGWPIWIGGAVVSALASSTFFILTPLADIDTQTAGLQLSTKF